VPYWTLLVNTVFPFKVIVSVDALPRVVVPWIVTLPVKVFAPLKLYVPVDTIPAEEAVALTPEIVNPCEKLPVTEIPFDPEIANLFT
jgi:hypothetical protein